MSSSTTTTTNTAPAVVDRAGKCQVCQKPSKKSCLKCQSVFYCNAEHRNADRANHKKQCKPQGPPQMELMDVCNAAARIFCSKFLIPEHRVGFVGNVPFDLRNIDGKDYYLVKEVQGMGIDDSRQFWLQKGFSRDQFWSVFCLGKSPIFHYSFVSALRCLINEKGYNIMHEGKPVLIFGTAVVDVKKEYTKIIPVFDWSKKHVEDWYKYDVQSDVHEVIWISTGEGRRFIIDFTAPAYGIFEYSENEKPFYIASYDKQPNYAMQDRGLRFPDNIDKTLQDLVKTSEERKDIRPAMTMSARNLIVNECVVLSQ